MGMFWAFSNGRMTYPLTSFGTKHRTDSRPVTANEHMRCDVCGDVIEDGERRRYAKQQVALGIPIRTLDWGENGYCRDCLAPEFEFESGTRSHENFDHAPNLEREE